LARVRSLPVLRSRRVCASRQRCCTALGDPVKFACYLLAALLASSLKVTLPGIDGTLSVNFLFTLLGILETRLTGRRC